MLRITVHDKPGALTFQLEGRLAGPWVRVLEECWQSSLASHRRRLLSVDLTGMTFIDDAGQACLAAMHRQGAVFIAADPLTKGIVAEITEGHIPTADARSVKDSSDRRAQTGNDTWSQLGGDNHE
jgi:hypothetical protein